MHPLVYFLGYTLCSVNYAARRLLPINDFVTRDSCNLRPIIFSLFPFMPTQEDAQPGSQEYAAAASEGVRKHIERIKAQMSQDGADDLLTILWSVAYENREGICVGVDGEPNSIVETMAVAILKLADSVQAKLLEKEQFLPDKQRTPYPRIVANIETQLMMALKHMTQDRINAEKESHIIVPRTDDGLIHLPNATLAEAPPKQKEEIVKSINRSVSSEKKLRGNKR